VEKQQLYQVRVLLNDDKCVDVGPQMVQESANQFCDAIKAQIRLGKERVWREPIVYPVYH
jgi:hypothetical protein